MAPGTWGPDTGALEHQVTPHSTYLLCQASKWTCHQPQFPPGGHPVGPPFTDAESEVQRGVLGQQAGDWQNQGVNPDLPDASARF